MDCNESIQQQNSIRINKKNQHKKQQFKHIKKGLYIVIEHDLSCIFERFISFYCKRASKKYLQTILTRKAATMFSLKA